MNEPRIVNVLALLLAALAAWAWVRRRALARVIERLRQAQPGPAGPPSPSWSRTEGLLFLLSIGVYASTRLIGLERFPIYFFTDEAANAVLAAEFLANGLRDASGDWLPLYFANSEKLSLSLSVYLQVVPTLIFGTTVYATRAASALVSLSGAAAVGLILRDAFGQRTAWLGVMLLAITPAWFLHSRTAFESTLYVSLFAWFLYFYLRYRAGRVRAFFPAVLFGTMSFYAYNAGQPGLLVCAGLLLVTDWRYHWSNRRVAVGGIALAFVLAVPYLRFLAVHPGELGRRLEMLDSYLVRPDRTVLQDLGEFGAGYAQGLNPVYWYAPDNGRDLVRHQMKGYGHLLWPLLPLAALGLVLSLRHWRDPPHRAVLIALVAAPVGAALVGPAVTRELVFVVPATILVALGGVAIARRVFGRRQAARGAVLAFFAFTIVAVGMLWDALANGPTWYSDYGLTGMQYGAREVFDATSDYLSVHPESQAWIFPSAWNGSDMLRRFFAPDNDRIVLLNLDSFLEARYPTLESALVVLTARDYARVMESGKFTLAGLGRVVLLPDGSPGFYLARLEYSAAADDLFTAELESRSSMIEEATEWNGQRVIVHHSPFDLGSIKDLLDGDPATFVRTAGVNPAVLVFEFDQPLRLTRLRLTAGHSDLQIVLGFDRGLGFQPGRYEHTLTDLTVDTGVELVLDPPPGPTRRLTIEVQDLQGSASGQVHLRELDLLE